MMRIGGNAVAGLVFVLVAAGPLVSGCSADDGKHVLPISVQRDVTTVTVRIGQTVIPKILLDTGMAFDGVMIYNPAYRDSLDLSQAVEVQVGGAGSGKAPTALMIDSAAFFLGDTQLTNQRIVMLQSDIYKGFPTNGVMGYSIFGHHATEIDYDANTITLHAPGALEESLLVGEGWTPVAIYFKSNAIPWVDVSVVVEDEDPVPLSTYIDFAAREVIELLERPATKFRMPADTKEVHLGTGLSGEIYGRVGRISKLIIGPYELKDVPAAIAPAEVRSKQENADAVIGSGALRRFNLIFDYAGKRLYLKPNKAFGAPAD